MAKRVRILPAVVRLVLAAALLLAGACGPDTSPRPASTTAAAGQPQLGRLLVNVLWPIEKAGTLRKQAIPDSAATVTLTVKNSNNFVMGTTTANRGAGVLSLPVSVVVAVGTNYSVIAEAKDSTPALIAQGSAAGVSVTQNNTTSLNIVMTASSVPSITALSQANGGAGTSLTLTGTNFGHTRSTTYQVYFNATANSDNTVTGTQATTVSRSSDTAITATVPSGASNGNVIVRADGIPSVSTANFTVIQSISLSPANPNVNAGATQAFTPTVTDTASQSVSSPVLAWSSSDTAVGTITAGGVLTGVKGGTTTVAASSGNVSGSTTAYVKPAITSISPSSGMPGSSVTISGAGYGNPQGGQDTVKFNGVAATIGTWDTGSVTATVPATATTGNIVVNVGGQDSNGVSYFVGPWISSLSATTNLKAGDLITITGLDFGTSTDTVSFNGTNATSISSWANLQIQVYVPFGAKSGNVTVIRGSYTSNGSPFAALGRLDLSVSGGKRE